jgi:hypothetical protein
MVITFMVDCEPCSVSYGANYPIFVISFCSVSLCLCHESINLFLPKCQLDLSCACSWLS